ncbi:MAG TPA: type 4a pilus biogenesis protein PilO [Candidatus Saccharimonadales bacterium]|jgi:Tfp pilus assembly protein PilO|nr:type 4a pilus biogenesis protein PilO [Candidatus Saccharimonadales bacterium]
MRRDFKLQKRGILVAVALLITADVVLAVYSWRVANAPQTPRALLNDLQLKRDLLRTDIKHAEEIKNDIPAIQKDCEQFEKALRSSSEGYSALSSEIGEIAKKAGLHVEGLGFKQKEISGRSMDEVAVEATVSGEYGNVVRFLNGLQRSQNMYAVDALSLASDTSGQGTSNVLRVAIHLKTYFRTA